MPDKPYKCPVCGGCGVVPKGFYWPLISSTDSPETCRTCGGEGAIWRKKILEVDKKSCSDSCLNGGCTKIHRDQCSK